jgi:glycosyltransferase A (GT-A) superfamily protein (DUF2064 family)
MSNVNTPAGYIVSWRVPAVVELSQLRAGLVAAGLDPDMAPDLTPASLVARTSSFIAKLTSIKDSKKLARPLSHMARQLTREDAIADRLTYTREAAIQYDDQHCVLTSDEPQIAAMLPESAKTVTATRTASDVTRIVQRVVSESGSDLIPVREQGGAYFIPQGHGIIARVSTLLQAIGGELSTFACTIGHGSDASIANTITDYMLKQIDELKTSIDELNEAGIRADVKSRRLSRVAELRERIGAYAALVSTQGSKLTQALDVAEATLLAKLGPQSAPETPAAEQSEAA